MSIKGAIQPNHIPVNTYRLLVVGLPPLTATKLSGIEEELETVSLPDRTSATGGYTKSGEFTMMLPLHHTVEQAAMEKWFRDSQEPVAADYKKPATLVHISIDGRPLKSFTLIGIFPSKRKLPDLEMKNEGEMAEAEWTLKWDQMIPI